MSKTFLRVMRWLLLLTTGLTLVTACLRLDPPDTLTCEAKEQCDDGQKCIYDLCVDQDYCRTEFDCEGPLKGCRNNKCVDVECNAFSVQGCKGFACGNENRCLTSCQGDFQCRGDNHCEAGKCVPGKPLSSNGLDCTADDDCQSGKCCVRSSGKKCSDSCAPAGSSCTMAADCQADYCCAQAGGGSVCSSSACTFVKCSSDDDCGFGEYCSGFGSCTAQLENGATCGANRECLSSFCSSAKCQGSASPYEDCETEYDCAGTLTCCNVGTFGRVCASNASSCLKDIGYPCDESAACANNRCEDATFCTKTCTTNADCGMGPFGQNVCVKEFGEPICFPGCTASTQCEETYEFYGFSSICHIEGGLGYCDIY